MPGFAGIVRGREKGGDSEFATKDMRECLGYVSKAVGSVDEKNHSINFVISCDSIDRFGDIVEQSAIAAASWMELMTLVPPRIADMLKEAGLDSPEMRWEAAAQSILDQCRDREGWLSQPRYRVDLAGMEVEAIQCYLQGLI